MVVQKPKRTSPLAWIRTHKTLFVLLIIVLVVIGVFTYEKVSIYQNKRDFRQARVAIDEVYADIVSQVGQPDNFKRTSFCSRSYREFTGYGSTTCEVSTEFIYGVSTEDEANAMLKKIQSVFSQNKQFKIASPLSSAIGDTTILDTIYHASHDHYEYKTLGCINSFVFDTPRQMELYPIHRLKKGFEVSISCSAPAEDEYYPLAS